MKCCQELTPIVFAGNVPQKENSDDVALAQDVQQMHGLNAATRQLTCCSVSAWQFSLISFSERFEMCESSCRSLSKFSLHSNSMEMH